VLAIRLVAPSAASGAAIPVTTTQAGINGDAACSLQEAIDSANFDSNQFVDPAHPGDPPITTGCVAGSGDDTLVLPDGAVFTFATNASSIVDDPYDYLGPTVTPIVFTKIAIEGNGARLERPNPARNCSETNFRAFAVGSAWIEPVPGAPPVSGTGDLTLRNLTIKGFTARGGDGAAGGGGGMGAGGGIYVNGGALTVENSTFEDDGACGARAAACISRDRAAGAAVYREPAARRKATMPIRRAAISSAPWARTGRRGGGSRGNGGANGGYSPYLIGWVAGNGGGGGGTCFRPRRFHPRVRRRRSGRIPVRRRWRRLR
jgi:hypothetical protein